MDPLAKDRVDKWLWHARFFKTRSLASKIVSAGHVRVNSQKISKPSTPVGSGDVLTFVKGDRIKVVKIKSTALQRGPAPEAKALYEDMSPHQETSPRNPKFEGKGRPSKKDRRAIDKLQ